MELYAASLPEGNLTHMELHAPRLDENLTHMELYAASLLDEKMTHMELHAPRRALMKI